MMFINSCKAPYHNTYHSVDAFDLVDTFDSFHVWFKMYGSAVFLPSHCLDMLGTRPLILRQIKFNLQLTHCLVGLF